MQSYSCMLCKRSDLNCVNICSKNGRNSVKEDLLDLYGSLVEQHLKSDDQEVCIICVQVIDNMVRLKHKVYEVIVDSSVSRKVWGRPGTKALNLAKVWNLRLATTSPSYTSYDGTTEGVSPNDLLIITGSIPSDQRSDTDMEIANSKYRNYNCNTPSLDREVQDMTSRHRRRVKGHKWIRRKGSQRSKDRSRASSRSYSRTSRISNSSRISRATTTSKKQIQKQSEDLQMQRILSDLLYQNDSLSQFAQAYLGQGADNLSHVYGNGLDRRRSRSLSGTPFVKTRFASILRDKVLSEYERLVYECPEYSCHETFYNLEEITKHRVNKHNEMALFWCDECKFSYLSQEHLDKHKDIHFGRYMQYCIYCSEEFRNKKQYEAHLNEHLIHSFPCIYCDKFFLRKQLCEQHIREQHPGRKRKIKRIKPQSILDRIDKDPKNSRLSGHQVTNSSKDSQEFVVKILWQHGRPEDSSTAIEGDLEDGSCDLNFEEEMGAVQENELISSSC